MPLTAKSVDDARPCPRCNSFLIVCAECNSRYLMGVHGQCDHPRCQSFDTVLVCIRCKGVVSAKTDGVFAADLKTLVPWKGEA